MKGKKALSLMLAAVMALTLAVAGVPARAAGAEAADTALQAVTLAVKNTLGLDTASYSQFSGIPSEELLFGRRWELEWSGDGGSLSVRADDQGKIYSYDKSSVGEDVSIGRDGRLNIPALPTGDSTQALRAAEAFLNKVLTPGVETVELKDNSRPSLYRNIFRFSGMIYLNGEESPLDCSLTVRASDNEVIRFFRSDAYGGYSGTLPSPTTTVTELQARRDLRTTLKLEAYYVLEDDGATARVRYVPQYTDDYYVDGKTGKLVNLTELREKLWLDMESGSGAGGNFSTIDKAEIESAPTLSQAELDGAARLAGAKDKNTLDTIVKNSWPEIGLDKYTLASANYTVKQAETDGATEGELSVTCRLVYGRKLTDATARKVVTMNAKTGELIGLTSYRPYQENLSKTVSYGQAMEIAEDILLSFAGKNYSSLELYNPSVPGDFAKTDTQFDFIYTQKANGYFFPDNSYYVSVDAVDGSISQLEKYYNEDVELVNPGKVVSATEAAEAYANAMELYYGYVKVPTDVRLAEPQLYAQYKNELPSYVTTLAPGFVLTQPERWVRGVDAATGEAVFADDYSSQEEGIAYDDVAGTWIEPAANTLAQYGVGFYGGSLRRNETLTQLDMVALLCALDEYTIDLTEATDRDIDDLYLHAYTLGILTPEQRGERKTVTRGELVKIILNAAGYQKVAALPGIFHCDFSDAAAIAPGDYGYAALAQGLGLVQGGPDGAYAGQRTATRGEAIAMLYQYMS